MWEGDRNCKCLRIKETKQNSEVGSECSGGQVEISFCLQVALCVCPCACAASWARCPSVSPPLLLPLQNTTLIWWCQFLVDKDTADFVSACAWICQMGHIQLFLMELSLAIKYSDDGSLAEVPFLLGAWTWPTVISSEIWVVRP